MDKNPHCFLLLPCFLAILLLACSGEPNDLERQLERLQAQGNENPTAALTILKSMEGEVKGHDDDRLWNKYLLLRVRLSDKSNLQPASADTASSVCAFFDKSGTASEKAEAHYYLASTYRDLGDYPQAVSHFTQSADYLQGEEQAGFDASLLVRVYSQRSYLHGIQYDYDSALSDALESFRVAEKYHINDAITIMDVATAYAHKGDTARCMEYCNMALDSIERHGDHAYMSDVTAELLSLYSKNRDGAPAAACYHRLQKIPAGKRPHNYLYAMASYHESFSPKDSAVNAYKQLYEGIGTWHGIAYASKFLTKYYHDAGDYRQSSEYALAYQEASGKELESRMLELTAKGRGEQVYRRDKERELEAIAKAQRTEKRMYTISILLLLAVIALALWLYHNKRGQLDRILQKSSEIQHINQLLEQAEKELQQKREQLQKLDDEYKESERLGAEYTAKLLELLREARAEQGQGHGEGNIIDKFRKAAEDQSVEIQPGDWNELSSQLEKMYPGFVTQVQVQAPRNSKALHHICYLMKLGFTNTEITTITKSPRQTVWYRVNKLKKTMGGLLSAMDEPQKAEAGTPQGEA